MANNSAVQVSLVVALLWAVSPIIHKHVFKHDKLSPMTMLVVSFPFYLVAVLLYAWVHRRQLQDDVHKLNGRVMFWLAISSLLGGFLANVLYFQVLQHHDSYIVTTIMYSSPLFVFLLALALLKERVSAVSALGVLLIVLGTVLIAYHEHVYPSDGFHPGPG